MTVHSPEVPLQKVIEAPVLPAEVHEELLDEASDYYSDDSEAYAELEMENACYRRNIAQHLTEAAQLASETEVLENHIEQLELDIARDEHLYRCLRRRRSKQSVRPKRLVKSKAGSKSVPKGPKRRSHRKGT